MAVRLAVMPSSSRRTSWAVVATFAVAMAWVEAACVYDLRLLVDRLEPYQSNPLPISGALGMIELAREVATLVMLATVGWLAGGTVRARLAYAAIAFGIWDIFYYAWLRVMYGWPTSLLDWDVLFLLPLPWWGPVIAPVSIALLLIVWGTLATASPVPASVRGSGSPRLWSAAGLGAALALYVFMADALRAAPQGLEAVRMVLPGTFNWPVFLVALALMAVPVVPMIRTALYLARLTQDSSKQETYAASIRGLVPRDGPRRLWRFGGGGAGRRPQYTPDSRPRP